MRTAIPVVNRSASVSSAAESCHNYKNEWAYDDSGVVSYPGRVVGDFEVLDELANKREDEGEGDLSVMTRIRSTFERESRGSGCTGSANRIKHRTSTCSVDSKRALEKPLRTQIADLCTHSAATVSFPSPHRLRHLGSSAPLEAAAVVPAQTCCSMRFLSRRSSQRSTDRRSYAGVRCCCRVVGRSPKRR